MDVTDSSINVVAAGLTRVNHKTISELHALGSLTSQLTRHHDLTTLSARLHDETEHTIAGPLEIARWKLNISNNGRIGHHLGNHLILIFDFNKYNQDLTPSFCYISRIAEGGRKDRFNCQNHIFFVNFGGLTSSLRDLPQACNGETRLGRWRRDHAGQPSQHRALLNLQQIQTSSGQGMSTPWCGVPSHLEELVIVISNLAHNLDKQSTISTYY